MGIAVPPFQWCAWALNDQTNPFAAAVNVYRQWMPGAIIMAARASVVVGSAAGNLQFDCNSGGLSILSTPVTILAGQTSSRATGTVQPVILPASVNQIDNWLMGWDIDSAGDGAAIGAVMMLLIRWTAAG